MSWIETQEKQEFAKVAVINGFGIVLMIVLIVLSRWICPQGDPGNIVWKACQRGVLILEALLGALNAATFFNFVSDGNWWYEIIQNKNIAVAITAAGLFIGIGIAVCGAG
jgi:hypothetical protein